MRSMTPNRRTLVKVEVVDVEKRRVPSKHYSYVINVSWSDQSETVIYRRYSKFFEFQIILLETFPWEGGLKEPSARSIPFLPGKILFRRSHVRDVAIKRLKPIDEYCKALILLPPHISRCDHVLDFFEPRQEDFNPIREESSRRRREEQVTRSKSLRYVRRTRSLEIGEISGPLLLEPYLVIADYNSTQQKELTIYVGQRLEVIEKNENGWWFVSDEEGERGWVPGVYLEKPDGSSEDLVTKRAEPGHGEHYVTTHGYTAENADDISFGAGVVVEVLQKNLEGWWLVSYNGKQGFAPASYLEKSHNWVPESRGVEIISSIRDLKQHRHSLPSNSLQTSISLPSQRIINLANSASRSKDTNSISETPLSPVSPTYKKEKTVQPPPKRSSVKRTTKRRPELPPPLPPTVTEEPTYEYMTIAQFDSTIPDGVSFNEEKKVQVLEKSPGGWWFVKIDGDEGWAPASYIEKREAVKTKVAPPSRPNRPSTQKNSSIISETTPSRHFSPVRKVPSVPSAIAHPILEKNFSVPSSFSQSALSPANRPLPPLPKKVTASQSKGPSETYEEVGSSQHQSETAPPKAPRVPSALSKNMQHNAEKASENTVNSGAIDFRSVLKSSIAAKHTEIKNKSDGPSQKSSHSPSINSCEGEPRRKSNSMKSQAESKATPPKLPTAQKPTVGRKVSNPPERSNNFRKSSVSNPSNAAATQARATKPTQLSKSSNEAPKLPLKPKPSASSVRNMSSADDGAVTDFRSVLRSKQRKQSETSNGVGRSHSFSADRVLSVKAKDQQNKPPSLPKKPGNLPMKPAVTVKPSKEESNVRPSVMKKAGTTRPPWNAGTKPVLRRYQNNNNSNSQEPVKKPVFTVGHARVEITHPPGLREILTKRGSPDGQVDVKFVDGGKENRSAPVTPPERNKRATRRASDKDASKATPKTSQSENTPSNFYITVSNYTGVEESEISFGSGVKAEVLDRAENDWWYVQVGNNVGWAPSSFFRPASSSDFTEKVGYVSPDLNKQSEEYYDDVYAEIPEDQSRGFPATYVAAADFEADQSSTLSLRVGDRVTVTQEADGGWWYAILSDGAGEGWVPSSYLDPAS